MAAKRSSSEFGLDSKDVDKIDWELSIKRILVDVRSDFIYAPHISNVFRNASADLIDEVKSELRNGRFAPVSPVTIEVPKSARMQVIPRGSRGPSFSRPGSILLPKDRILYQALADAAAPLIDKKTDKSRSFSHWIAGAKSEEMFISSRATWNQMQKALGKLSDKYPSGYVIKADVANCFGSINQHTLVNHLEAIEYPSTLKNALDAFLVLSTGDRNSRGLLQGIFPSDLFGNFYLSPVDEFLADEGVPSVRYVDDFYLFVNSLDKAESVTRALTLKLRDYDLGLNDAKSKLLTSKSLVLEEPDLDKLFEKARDERAEQLEDIDDDGSDYGFQSEWEDDEEEDEDEEDLDLKATEDLFDSVSAFPLHAEKIERFCLPLFATAGSPYAVGSVIQSFTKRPAMSQIYSVYLAHFLASKSVRNALASLLSNEELHYDWQRMWVLAALLTYKTADDDLVKAGLKIFKDGSRHEALRAVAAIFVAKHGSFSRKKELADNYSIAGSVYLQTALLYGLRYFQSTTRKAYLKAWSGHSPTHALIAHSI